MSWSRQHFSAIAKILNRNKKNCKDFDRNDSSFIDVIPLVFIFETKIILK